MASACPACGKPVPEVVPKCPFCGKTREVTAPTPAARPPAPPPRSPTPAFEPVDLWPPERAGGPWRVPTWLHAVLLLGALPLIVPSLVLNRLQARRWGRVPVAMIVFDVVLLGAFALGQPRLLPVFLVAVACTAALTIVRARHLQPGLYLGYSPTVASGLIAAGVFLLVGAFSTFSFLELKRAVEGDQPVVVNADEVATLAVKLDQRVQVRQPLLWQERVWRVDGAPDLQVVETPTPPPGATALWAPFQDGEGVVWAALPLSATEPRSVSGWLRAPTDAENQALLQRWGQTHVGGGPRRQFTLVATGETGAPPPQPPPAPAERSRWGLALLALGLVVAAASVATALKEG